MLDTPSGVHRWVDGKLVDVTDQLRHEFEEQLETKAKIATVETEGFIAQAMEALQKKGIWAVLILLGGSAIGSVTAYGQVMGEAGKRGADAGEKVVRDVVQEQKYLRQDVDHVTKKTERVEKLVELLLDKSHVSEAARPAPVPEPLPRDGGR